MQIRLIQLLELAGTVELLTGLHIGAGKESIEIGGVDGPVVKHPHTGEPYIPGSSLKGKLRSLMEWATHKVPAADNQPYYGVDANGDYEADDALLRIFGVSAKKWRGGPSRLIVRDSFLIRDWVKQVTRLGLPLVEEKTEVTIDRIQGKAAAMGPRTMERVPAGAQFRLEMLFKVFDVEGDGGRDDRACLNELVKTMKLLEQDALGGSGSRGYGRLRLLDLTLRSLEPPGEPRSIQSRFEALKSFSDELDIFSD